MSAAEFELQWADYIRSPWGDARGDLQAGVIASTVHNMAGKMAGENDLKVPFDYLMFKDKPEQCDDDEQPSVEEHFGQFS